MCPRQAPTSISLDGDALAPLCVSCKGVLESMATQKRVRNVSPPSLRPLRSAGRSEQQRWHPTSAQPSADHCELKTDSTGRSISAFCATSNGSAAVRLFVAAPLGCNRFWPSDALGYAPVCAPIGTWFRWACIPITSAKFWSRPNFVSVIRSQAEREWVRVCTLPPTLHESLL